MIFSVIISALLFADEGGSSLWVLFAIAIVFFAVLIGLKSGFDLRISSTGFAIDDTGRIFRIRKGNDDTGLIAIGLGGAIKGISTVASTVASAAGSAAQFYTYHRTTQLMQNPNVVAEIAKNARQISPSSAQILEILNVYNHTITSKTVKIRCDYRNTYTGKIYYNKTITIYKAYKCFNELIQLIITHRVA